MTAVDGSQLLHFLCVCGCLSVAVFVLQLLLSPSQLTRMLNEHLVGSTPCSWPVSVLLVLMPLS